MGEKTGLDANSKYVLHSSQTVRRLRSGKANDIDFPSRIYSINRERKKKRHMETACLVD